MRSRTVSFTLAVLFALTINTAAVPPQGWALLGDRSVTNRLDHDNIRVTAQRGQFRSIKLQVKNRAVSFHKVIVHFGNGADFEVELRNTIPAGGESRQIDLPGDRRNIRSVDLYYDAKSLGAPALVRLFGIR
jgi:hypothetical protein